MRCRLSAAADDVSGSGGGDVDECERGRRGTDMVPVLLGFALVC